MSGCIGRGPKPTKQASVKKPAKPKVKKPSKSELLEEASELLKRIEKKEQECQQVRADVEIRKEAYRTARASCDERVEELRSLCRARKEKHPLFDQPAKLQEPEKPAEAESAAPAETTPAGKDGWRTIAIHEVITNYSLAAKLFDADMTTLGKLSDRMMDQGQWWWRQFKGIGEESAAKIRDMMADFWKAHPEYCEEKNPAAA